MNKYPRIVTLLTSQCEAWIIGSAADPNEENPRDYDIFVPIQFWQRASGYLPKDFKVNSFGGLKITEDNIEIDIWTGDMLAIISTNYFKFAFQPKLNIRIGKI